MKQKIRKKGLDEGLKSFVSVLKSSSRELKKKPTNPHTHHTEIPEKGNRHLSLHSCDFPALRKVTSVMRVPTEQQQKKMRETTQTC